MKFNIAKLSLLVGIFATVSVFQSCTDLDPYVYSEMDSEEFKKSDGYISSELGKVYAHLQREYGYVYREGYWSVQENTSDECCVPTRWGGDWYDGGVFWDLHNSRFNPKLRELAASGISANGAFAMPYNGIAKINAMIKTMKSMGTDEKRPEIMAELKVFRAWYHMCLMDVFGRVGFYTEYTDLSGNHPQYDREVVCDSIMRDLLANVPLLDKEKHYCRINYYVGEMIMAKMYLNAKAWGVLGKSKEIPSDETECYKKVVALCDDIINNGGYSLEPNYFDNFKVDNENSKENMWCVYYDATSSKGMQFNVMTLHYSQKDVYGMKETPWNGYCTSHKVIGLYGEGDKRIDCWARGAALDASGKQITVEVAVDSLTYVHMPKYVRKPDNWPNKIPAELTGTSVIKYQFPAYFTDTITTLTNTESYKLYNIFEGPRFLKFEIQKGVGAHMSNDFPIYRLADVYLMKAEACLRGGGDQNDGLAAVNMVRSRAGATPFGALNEEDLCNERCRELCWEGHRRTDLIRFDRFTGAKSLPNDADPANLWILKTNPNDKYDTNLSGRPYCKPEDAAETPETAKVCAIPDFMVDYGYTQNPGY